MSSSLSPTSYSFCSSVGSVRSILEGHLLYSEEAYDEICCEFDVGCFPPCQNTKHFLWDKVPKCERYLLLETGSSSFVTENNNIVITPPDRASLVRTLYSWNPSVNVRQSFATCACAWVYSEQPQSHPEQQQSQFDEGYLDFFCIPPQQAGRRRRSSKYAKR